MEKPKRTFDDEVANTDAYYEREADKVPEAQRRIVEENNRRKRVADMQTASGYMLAVLGGFVFGLLIGVLMGITWVIKLAAVTAAG